MAFIHNFRQSMEIGKRGEEDIYNYLILIVGLVVGFVLLYFNHFFPYVDLTFLKSIGSPALEIGFISLGLSFLMFIQRLKYIRSSIVNDIYLAAVYFVFFNHI